MALPPIARSSQLNALDRVTERARSRQGRTLRGAARDIGLADPGVDSTGVMVGARATVVLLESLHGEAGRDEMRENSALVLWTSIVDLPSVWTWPDEVAEFRRPPAPARLSTPGCCAGGIRAQVLTQEFRADIGGTRRSCRVTDSWTSEQSRVGRHS